MVNMKLTLITFRSMFQSFCWHFPLREKTWQLLGEEPGFLAWLSSVQKKEENEQGGQTSDSYIWANECQEKCGVNIKWRTFLH